MRIAERKANDSSKKGIISNTMIKSNQLSASASRSERRIIKIAKNQLLIRGWSKRKPTDKRITMQQKANENLTERNKQFTIAKRNANDNNETNKITIANLKKGTNISKNTVSWREDV